MDELGQDAHQPGAVSVQVVGLGLVFIGRVDDRRLEGAGLLSFCCAEVLGVLGKLDSVGADTSARGGGEASRSSSLVLDGWPRGSQGLGQRPAPAELARHSGRCSGVVGRSIDDCRTFPAWSDAPLGVERLGWGWLELGEW